MKKLKKILVMAASLVAITFVGCSGIGNTATYTTQDGPARTTEKTITLTATGDEEIVKFPEAAPEAVEENFRTILPASLDATTLKYYLVYKDLITNDTVLPKAPINFTKKAGQNNDNVGTVPLNIPDSYYEFTLYATKGTVDLGTPGAGYAADTLASKAVLMGKTSADLRGSTDRVHFYLSPDGLTNGASVSLKLYTDGWTYDSAKYSVVAGLRNISTDAVEKTDASAFSIPNGTAPSTAQYTAADVTPGTYNFVVRFTQQAAIVPEGSSAKVYEYSDRIIVLANNDIEQAIAIPNIIEEAPNAPGNLKVSYKDPVGDSEYYFVNFKWDDNSNNESYFQLELLAVADDALLADINADTTTPWSDTYLTTIKSSSASLITKYGKGFYGSENWVAGSLMKNNKSVTVKLPLEKRYLARLSSRNDAGMSAYTYADFSLGGTGETGYSDFVNGENKTINRYRLTYELYDGTITPKIGTPSSKAIVEYRSQNEIPQATPKTYLAATAGANSADIMDPLHDTNSYTSLVKDGNAWTSWKVGDIQGKPSIADVSDAQGTYLTTAVPAVDNPGDLTYVPGYDAPNDYKGFKNLTLFACYKIESADVLVYDPTVFNITSANVTATGTGVTSAIATKNTVELDLSTTGAGAISWKAAYTTAQTDASVVWDKVLISIRRMGSSTNLYKNYTTLTNGEFIQSIDFKPYAIGKYEVKFSAFVKNSSTPYTYNVYLSIVEGAAVARPKHKITFATPANASALTAEVNGNPYTSAADVEEGAVITFTVTPASDYAVLNWDGATATSATTATYTVGAGDATFAMTLAAAHALTITPPASGTLTATVHGIAITSGGNVAEGATVTLTATPIATEKFSAFGSTQSGAGSFTVAPTGPYSNGDVVTGTYTMPTADDTVSVTFN